jgi:hypothetical protein
MRRIFKALAALLFLVLPSIAHAQSYQTGFVYVGLTAGAPASCVTGQLAFFTDAASGSNIYGCVSNAWVFQGGSGSFTYPAAGVPLSTGSAWGASYTVGTSANDLVQLNSSGQLPAVSGALLTNLPSSGTVTTTGSPTTPQLAQFMTGSPSTVIGGIPGVGGGVNPLFVTITGTPPAGQVVAFVGGIAVNNYLGVAVNPQTGGYTLNCSTGDRFDEIEFNISAASTLSIPQAGGTACTQTNYGFVVRNASTSTAVLTVTATTSLFEPEASSSKSLLPGESAFVYSDAVSSTGNYHAVVVHASEGGTVTYTASSGPNANDNGKLVIMNCTSACTYTVGPQFSTQSWHIRVMSVGSTLATITLAGGDTFNGGSAPTLTTKVELDLWQDSITSTNFYGTVFASNPTGISPIAVTAGAISLQNSAFANVTAALGTDTEYFTASGSAMVNGHSVEGDAGGGITDSGSVLVTPASTTTFTGKSLSADQLTGAAAQATLTETAALHEITFAGVETAALTYPYSFTDANSTNNNSSGAVIIGTTGTSTGAVPLIVNEATVAGDIMDLYTGGTVSNGVFTAGTLLYSFGSAANPTFTIGKSGGGGATIASASGNITLSPSAGSEVLVSPGSVSSKGIVIKEASGTVTADGFELTNNSNTVLTSIGPSGLLKVYDQMTTVDLGAEPIIGSLHQTSISTANSGSAQNVLASTPAAGFYKLHLYADQSAGCTTLGSGALTVTAGWTDATAARVSSTLTLTVATSDSGTGDYIDTIIPFWAAASSAVTVTATYTACTTGTWTYDLHAEVLRGN